MKKNYISPSIKSYAVVANNILAGSGTAPTTAFGSGEVSSASEMGAKGSSWTDDED